MSDCTGNEKHKVEPQPFSNEWMQIVEAESKRAARHRETEDELRLKEKTVTLTNQQLVEWAYTVKEMFEFHNGRFPTWDQANCNGSLRFTCSEMLRKHVDAEYLAQKSHCRHHLKRAMIMIEYSVFAPTFCIQPTH